VCLRDPSPTRGVRSPDQGGARAGGSGPREIRALKIR
jgi:hypothetical protein